MEYEDERMLGRGRRMNYGQERAFKMAEPEVAAMARGHMGEMAPMSKSAPDRIPMRPYAKGGEVTKEKRPKVKDEAMEIRMRRKREEQDRLFMLDKAKRKHEAQMGYDDRKMRETDRKMDTNERAMREKEHEMRKGRKVTKDCMKCGGKVTKMAAGGAAKVRKGVCTPSGMPKKAPR